MLSTPHVTCYFLLTFTYQVSVANVASTANV